MKITDVNLPIDADDLRKLLINHNVISASVFGSYARGDESDQSDLDILVTYNNHASLFDHLNLKADIEEKSGKSVDLVSSRSVSKYFAPFIDKDKIAIL